jgi:predicted amidohydrolase YtcJ
MPVFHRFVLLLTLASVGCSSSAGPGAAEGGQASAPSSATIALDTLYTGGDILTMVGDRPQYAEALGVTAGRIAFVGTREEAARLTGPSTTQVDLKGRTLLPGFQDTHGHLLLKMHNLDRLDLTPARSIDEVLGLFREYIAQRKPKSGEWILGYLAPKPLVLGRLLTKVDLDKISTEIPILAQESSGHIATLNTAGLKAMGLSASTPDPVGGQYRRMPGSRELNGIIDEAALIQTFSRLPPIPDERVEVLLREVVGLWLKHGFTTARELLAGLSSDDLKIARYAADKKLMPIDFIMYANAQLPEEDLLRHADWQGRYVNRVKMGGVKIMMDGVANGYTAHKKRPYAVLPAGYEKNFAGGPNVPPADVMKYVSRYYASPLQVNVHAMGDAAVENFVLAVEAARRAHGARDSRPMLHHAGLVTPDVAKRIAAAQIITVFNSAGVSGFGRGIEQYWGKEDAKYTMPARTILDAGGLITISTDCPSGPTEPMQFRDIYGLVSRKSFTDDYVNAPEERISAYEALVASTRAGAYGNFEEKTKGTLEVGKKADLVILDRNPVTIDPEELLKVTVLQTIVEGKTLYTRPQ